MASSIKDCSHQQFLQIAFLTGSLMDQHLCSEHMQTYVPLLCKPCYWVKYEKSGYTGPGEQFYDTRKHYCHQYVYTSDRSFGTIRFNLIFVFWNEFSIFGRLSIRLMMFWIINNSKWQNTIHLTNPVCKCETVKFYSAKSVKYCPICSPQT